MLMVVALNIGRLLMLCWVLYSVVLIFFPESVNHAPDRVGGAIQFVVAYTIGWGLDRLLGMVKRRRLAADAEG
jgi:hypothetical protein